MFLLLSDFIITHIKFIKKHLTNDMHHGIILLVAEKKRKKQNEKNLDKIKVA